MYGGNSYGSVSYGGEVETLVTYIVNLSSNVIMTPSFTTQAQKIFLENIKLTSIFSKSLVMLKSFTGNIKLTSFKLFTTSKTFLSNIVSTSIFTTLTSKVFLENIKMTSIFAKILSLVFLENIKLTSKRVFAIPKTFLSNIVMTPNFNAQTFLSFLSNIKLTSIFTKITTFFKTFTENVKMKTIYRMIYDGIIVGTWTKIAKASSSIWTKIIKN